MADGELKDMEHFFSTLPNPFSDSEVYKTSVVGECQLAIEYLHNIMLCDLSLKYIIITYINTSVTTAGRKSKLL